MQPDIMEENQHHLYISWKACKDNFVVPNFCYFFSLLREKDSFIFTRAVCQFFGP